MSNLAVGIALGTAISSASSISSSCSSDPYIPDWLAIIMLVTLVIAMAGTVIELYRKDSDFLIAHWERLLLGSAFGFLIWACIAALVSLLAFLCSFIF